MIKPALPRAIKPVCCFAMALVIAVAIASSSAFAAESDRFARDVQPFLTKYCVDCHGKAEPEADFRTDMLSNDVSANRFSWAAALERLVAGDMPPQDAEQPSNQEVKDVIAWIRPHLAASDATGPVTNGYLHPTDGNRVPHALLFGVSAKQTVPPPPRLWRLSPHAYTEGFLESLKSNRKDLAQPFSLIAEPGIKDYADLYTVDAPATEVLIRNADRIVASQTAHKLVADGDGFKVQMNNDTVGDFRTLLNPKVPPTPADLKKAISTQYRLALAREASEHEVQKLLSLYAKNAQAADHIAAARAMLMAPLLSTEAVYRFELGFGREVRPGVRMLAPRELASALNLAISDRRDRALFEAAAKNELESPEQVAAHVRRLLEDPKAHKRRLLGFFREYFGYDNATEIFKDKPKDVLHRPEQLVHDTDQLILYLLDRDKDVLKEMLTTPKSFVNYRLKKNEKTKQIDVPTQAVAAHPINDKGVLSPEALYGFSDWPAEQPVDLPGDRIGILMQPSWLVAWSGNFDNDPIRRGRFIRERFLGGRVPDLPIGVVAMVPNDPHRTLRSRLEVTRVAACWKCHQKMDELGLPFEQFSHYGKARWAEPVLDPEATSKNVDKKGKSLGPIYRDEPLNTHGGIAISGDPALDGDVKSAAELLRRLARSDRVRQVFVRHAFRYYLGRNETAGDAKTLQDADVAYQQSGGSFKALVVSLLSSESFLYRTVPAVAKD